MCRRRRPPIEAHRRAGRLGSQTYILFAHMGYACYVVEGVIIYVYV